MKRNVTIHQSDERMFFLQQIVERDSISFAHPTHIFAPNIEVSQKDIEQMSPSTHLFCGKCSQDALQTAENMEVQIHIMMKDENFQATNARLTAEGTLGIIIQRSTNSLEDNKYMILGFGRTGAAIARLLCQLGLTVDICTNSSSRPAHAFARHVLPLSGLDFSQSDVVINTVPHPIIDDKASMSFKYNALYIELASKPALNLEYVRYLGVDADIHPALPAKACPLSAAKAMLTYIKEVLL